MALGDGTAWDETSPTNATNLSDGDDHIVDLRKGVRIRMEYEHSTFGASSAGGKHKFITLQNQASKPTVDATQVAAVYTKTVSSLQELFFENEDGTEVQITSGSGLNVAAGTAYPPGHIRGGIITNNATDPTNDLDFTACDCRDVANTLNIAVAAFTKKIDATFTAGTDQGMLDTGTIGAVADIIYLFAIDDSTGVLAGDFLASKSRTAPTMPSGYNKKRLIGMRYWNGSSWALFTTNDQNIERWVYFLSPVAVLTSGTATSFTDVDVSSIVDPAVSRIIDVNCYKEPTGDTLVALVYLRVNGSTAALGTSTYFTLGIGGGSGVAGQTANVGQIALDSNGIFEYAGSNASSTHFYMRGYREDL